MSGISELSPSEKIILISYSKVFTPDDWDPVSEREPQKAKYPTINLANRAIQFTSFLGLPNSLKDDAGNSEVVIPSENVYSWETDKKVLWKVWKNMTFWNEEDTLPINISRAILPLLVYSFYSIYFTVRSIARVFTEFLPSTIANIFRYAAKNLDIQMQALVKAEALQKEGHNAIKNETFNPYINMFLQIITSLGYVTIRAGQFIFESIHFFGKSITSPVKGIRSAWKSAHKYAGDGLAGDLLGVLMVGLTCVSTITAYSLLFPLVVSLFSGFTVAGGTTLLLINIMTGTAPLSSSLLLLFHPVFEIGMGIGAITVTHGVMHTYDSDLEKNIWTTCKDIVKSTGKFILSEVRNIFEIQASKEDELDAVKPQRPENMLKVVAVENEKNIVDTDSNEIVVGKKNVENTNNHNSFSSSSLGFAGKSSTQPTPENDSTESTSTHSFSS